MDGRAEPDVAGEQGEHAQRDAGDDGADGFGKRFSEVDHAVGDDGHEDGVKSESLAQGLNQETSVKKFEGKKLNQVDGFPHEEVGQAGMGVVVKGVGFLETFGEGDGDHGGQDGQVEGEVNPGVFDRAREAQAVFAQGFTGEFEPDGGHKKIEGEGGGGPVEESGEFGAWAVAERFGEPFFGGFDEEGDDGFEDFVV